MWSSRRSLAAGIAVVVAVATPAVARAQSTPEGFASERLYTSAPGGGWIVMDNLDMHGGLGGAVAISGGYAKNPVRVASADGAQRFALVSDQAFAGVAVAVTYERFRVHASFSSPLVVTGTSGAIGAYQLTAPSVDPGSNPDTIADVRLGVDARLFGDPHGPLRLGASAQLYVPSGERQDFVTDGSYRAMARALVAGQIDRFVYAGQLGVHLRPLDDSPAPGSPRGSELLFGVAAGPRFAIGDRSAIVLGPEIFGETAFAAPFGATATGIEALLTGRVEGTREDGEQLRLKLGGGGGVSPHFGAPEFRAVIAVEVFDHNLDRTSR